MLNRHTSPALRALRTERSESLEFTSTGNAMELFGSALELYFGGDMEASLALTGQVAGRIEEILPVAEIISGTVAEFASVLGALAHRYLTG